MTNKCKEFLRELADTGYASNFRWLGFKIIQLPQDLQAYQEIIFKVKPNLIIETGVFLGGSSIYFASMLELCGIKNGRVIGIDINLRDKVKKEVSNHPLGERITLLQGTSISTPVVKTVCELAKEKRVLVHLDSCHTRSHVLDELRAYAPLVSIGSYIIVADTGVGDFGNFRGYTKNNNPKVAVSEFLKSNNGFQIDDEIQSKLAITGHPDGYLRKIK